jgi:hypothetical protein
MAALQERAMLVHLSLKHWSGSRNDKRVVAEVASAHRTNGRDIGRFSKNLIDPEALRPIKKLIGEARCDHYELTLPFDDDGYRLLPAAAYEGYCAVMRRHRARFEDRRAGLLDDYDRLILEAQHELGSLYDACDYPRRDQLAERFGFKTAFRPIPDGGHFVVEVAAEQKDAIDQDTHEAAERAMTEVWQRVHDRARKLTEGLRAYVDDQGEVQRNFRSSLIDNVVHLADLLPKLNFMGDPRLDQMARRLKDELGRYEAETLKEAPALRREVADKADAVRAEVDQVLRSMNGYL